jgi:hypothetical protein
MAKLYILASRFRAFDRGLEYNSYKVVSAHDVPVGYDVAR